MKWFNDDKRADLLFGMVGKKSHDCIGEQSHIITIIPINMSNITNLMRIILFMFLIIILTLFFEIFNHYLIQYLEQIKK